MILIITVLALLPSCSKDKPTSPKGDDYELVESGTVGPGGGTFGNEDFSLTVPPGAFGSDAQLELYVSTDDQPFKEYQITSAYRLEGVPDYFTQPLEVRIKYIGTLSDSANLAVGEEGIAYGSGESSFHYSLYQAADSSGYLVAQLPVRETQRSLRRAGSFTKEATTGSQGYLYLLILGLRDYFHHTSSGGHFLIWYPQDRVLLVDDLDSYLEAAFDTCLAMGFRYHSKKKWPQVVYIFPEGLMHSSEYGEFVSILGETGACIEYLIFNRDNFDDWNLPRIRMSAGREFVDLVLFSYTPFYPNVSSSVIPNQEWFDHAVERWSEEKFTDSPGHVPADFRSFEIEPLNGIQTKDEGDIEEHGKGMSALVKYLTAPDRFTDRVLAPIYQRIANSEEPPRAIVEHIDEYPNVWLPEFFSRYVGGQVYGVGANVFTDYNSITDEFQTGRDTAKTFTDTYQDLSARIYYIALDNQNLADAAELVFRVGSSETNDDNLWVIVFTLKDGILQLFEQGLEVTVGNVKGLTRDEYDLLAVVVNSSFEEWLFLEETDIDLEVKFKKAEFNYCWVYGAVVGHWRNSEGESYESWHSEDWAARGSFQNNVFTGSPIPEIDGSLCTGFVQVVVDPITRSVTSFSAEYFTPSSSNDMWWTWNISGGNVPYVGDLEWVGLMGDEYVCEGSPTSSCISDFESWWEQSDGWFQGFDYFHCDEDSRLEIRLYAVP
ncbi:hypothetical protein ACFL0G_03950 [Candidatus Zixiibacteriota bacterium]